MGAPRKQGLQGALSLAQNAQGLRILCAPHREVGLALKGARKRLLIAGNSRVLRDQCASQARRPLVALGHQVPELLSLRPGITRRAKHGAGLRELPALAALARRLLNESLEERDGLLHGFTCLVPNPGPRPRGQDRAREEALRSRFQAPKIAILRAILSQSLDDLQGLSVLG